ncbi:glycosyltransferase family 2 protein [Undibacterium sp.]|uniref:glycosyltransferase family 2 protein n=1 Tax=Undibacterium sp. TaxID=1914977 RepID=UPI0025DEEFA4|nr:glycosyltransferase family 2 protein [Undibacterium sp.]
MKLSIITCTRNSMAFLPETIRSVHMQSRTDFEHIFVDGNSTDGTLEYLRKLPGNNLILEGVGGGIARAMNEGIRAASGDVIAHMHSDDYYLGTDVFSQVLDVFENTDKQWLFGRIMSDVDGVLRPETYTVPRYSYNQFLRGNFIPHPATFIRRKVFEECGVFSETLRYAMDYDFFLRIARRYQPQQLDTHLAAFRRHDGSTTQANFMKSFAEDFEVRRMHAKWHQLPEATLRYLVRRQRHLKRLAAHV